MKCGLIYFSVLFDFFRHLAACQSVTVFTLFPPFAQQSARNKFKNPAK